MIRQTAPFFKLPLELIRIISNHLPPDGVLALTLTCRDLYGSVLLEERLKNTRLSRCERLATLAYLSKDLNSLRCIRCKAYYPVSSFTSSNSPACLSGQQIEVVELPPRMCSHHVGSLSRFVDTEQGGRDEWVSHTDKMCMHCGAVQGWGKCDCNCQTCCWRLVRTYTRYISNQKTHPEFRLWRDLERRDAFGQNHLMVREMSWDSGECNVVDREVDLVYER